MHNRGRWMRALGLAGGVASLAAGCATGGQVVARGTSGRGLRGSVVVHGAEARAAFAGPLHLLHVDFEGWQQVELYSVARRTGTDADCAGPPLVRLHLHARRTNPIDADVGAGEVLCLAGETSGVTGEAQPVTVSWHAVAAQAAVPQMLAAAFPHEP